MRSLRRLRDMLSLRAALSCLYGATTICD